MIIVLSTFFQNLINLLNAKLKDRFSATIK